MPNVQALADQGVLFRQAFCAAPTCSASRACLLTGQYGQTQRHARARPPRLVAARLPPPHRPHAARRRLHLDADRRAAHLQGAGGDRLRRGDQGADHARRHGRAARDGGRCASPREPPAVRVGRLLRDPPRIPRPRARCATSTTPSRRTTCRTRPRCAPTSRRSRRARARSTTASGMVLNQLDAHGLDEDTLIIFTTDHGMPFPGAKATLYDRGLGRDADPARARAVRRRPRDRRRSSRTSTSTPRCASTSGSSARRSCRASRCWRCCAARPTQRARGDLRRLDLARRL